MFHPKMPHRRTLTRTGIALALASGLVALAGCNSSSGGGEAAPTLTFATFGGAYGDAQTAAWLTEFTAETGIPVVSDAYDFGKLQSMVESGDVYWDVIDTSGETGLESTSNLLEPIDCTVVTSCDSAVPGLLDTDWRIAQNTSAMVFAYNKDVAGSVPQSWADFFDTDKFPGKRSFPAWVSGGALEAALLADGVASEDLYPLDVDRALKKLDTIKDDIIWWETGTQSEDLLSSGETVFSVVFSPRVYNLAVVTGAPVAAQWNQVLTIGNYVAIPKGTKNLEAAQKLVAFIGDKKNNANLGKFYPVGPGTEGASADVPSEIAEYVPTNHAETAVPMNDEYWDANFADVNATFQDWLQK